MIGEADTLDRQQVIAETEAIELLALPTRTNVHIHFSPHSSAEDIGDENEFKRHMKRADIFIPEEVSWNEEVKKSMQQIAKGNHKEYEPIRRAAQDMNMGFMGAVLKTLYNSHTAVDFVDVGRDHPLWIAVGSLMGSTEDVEEAMPEVAQEVESIDDYCKDRLDCVENWIIANRFRERFMLASLPEVIRSNVAVRPRLRKKPEVNVLMTLGTVHTNVYHQLCRVAGATNHITRSFSEPNIVFSEWNELIRAGLLNIDMGPELKKELVIKSFLTDFTREIARDMDLVERLGRYTIQAKARQINNVLGLPTIVDFLSEALQENLQSQGEPSDVFKKVVGTVLAYLDMAPDKAGGVKV
jgi:hypothetical protein